MSAHIYLEGGATGADSNEDKIRCRQGFRKLLENCGFAGRLPRLTPCGSRNDTLQSFRSGMETRKSSFVAMWVDSEDPISNVEETWTHLKSRDNWDRPAGATDDQLLLMTTCMETLIVADRTALRGHFKSKLQESALPPLENLEQRHRRDVQDRLVHASRDCSNQYAKGRRSFEVLSKLNPDTLEQLPSFKRARRILDAKL